MLIGCNFWSLNDSVILGIAKYFTLINDYKYFTSHREPAQLPEYSFRVNLEQPKEIGSMFITRQFYYEFDEEKL